MRASPLCGLSKARSRTLVQVALRAARFEPEQMMQPTCLSERQAAQGWCFKTTTSVGLHILGITARFAPGSRQFHCTTKDPEQRRGRSPAGPRPGRCEGPAETQRGKVPDRKLRGYP